MTVDAGRVLIELDTADGRVREVRIASERPPVAHALRGKPAAEAVALVPLIFALCGKAQGRAAALALAAARGVDTAPHVDAETETETLREHLWRLLLDLPPQLGLEARREVFKTAMRAAAAGDREAMRGVLDDPYWNEMLGRLAELEQPAAQAAMLLPVMGARKSLAVWPMLDEDFCRVPRWEGEAAETGAFARWGGQNPARVGAFAARWHARCAEVWSWAAGAGEVGGGGTASAVAAGPGIGRALVDTARGLLMHEIVLDGDRIADYRIVAPTEWNFHPHGILRDWLHGHAYTGHDALGRYVAAAVGALDPCVRHEVRIDA